MLITHPELDSDAKSNLKMMHIVLTLDVLVSNLGRL